jgi:catechol 2,3-dioxygenase-like lactoylglutathione lyase family enzyme
VSGILVHIGLVVSDMQRAENFYSAMFGFVRDRELRMTADQLGVLQLQPESDMHAIYLMLGSITLELMAFDPPSAETAATRTFNQTGLTHLSITVEHIAEACARAVAYGGSVIGTSARAAIIRDPDGQLLELVTMPVNDEIEQARAARAAGRG